VPAPRRDVPSERAVSRDNVDEVTVVVDTDDAHILAHSGQVKDPSPCACNVSSVLASTVQNMEIAAFLLVTYANHC